MSSIRIDVREVAALAGKLSSIDARSLGEAALGAVNESAVDFERRAIDSGVLNVNLQRTYVKGKTDLLLGANPNLPRAAITTKGDATVLGNFAPLGIVRAPGAQRRAGTIKGRRNAGTLVSIRRDRTEKQNQWFILPLKRGDIPGGNGLGVFVRDDALAPSPRAEREGKAGKRHIYGPAPYQLFRTQIEKQGPQWAEDLETRAVAKLLGVIERATL
jgi:hypothetical protein